ncbi:DUF768 domain-containing protein [Mesorhizobium huakuii]|uniref:DUF768 domain-containing protein n=1 Tax=Mesorhizobium huakuii TaxID=28104 RepID=A0A7G6T0X6_9HYPH|nr:DUF768 domain-containing protein [Mesorhizobium huakuii]QND60408.1 DUF768 domain-containing protein [Mesorhizobium huakuii]
MTERAVRFLHLWLERNDLLDGRPVDDAEISRFATQLFLEAEAEGIGETEISDSFDEVHKGLVDIIRRRHRPPALKQQKVDWSIDAA